jgi:hypothetical protein
LAIFSVFLGGLVGFWVVKGFLGASRKRKLGKEVASFDFYVDSPTPESYAQSSTR